jgi:hypothetical protein
MNEFEQKDYGQARTTADAIKTNGENILSIFDKIDHIMNTLYGESWESSGAENAQARYNEIRKNYEVFYTQVLNMHDHIYKVTASNEATDSRVSSEIANI